MMSGDDETLWTWNGGSMHWKLDEAPLLATLSAPERLTAAKRSKRRTIAISSWIRETGAL
jgi:hypothetical protein